MVKAIVAILLLWITQKFVPYSCDPFSAEKLQLVNHKDLSKIFEIASPDL